MPRPRAGLFNGLPLASDLGSMGPRQCCTSGLDLRLAAASVWRSRALPLRYLGSYLQLHAVPQLNFTIPADLLDRIDAAKPNFLDRKGFICLLLSEQLTEGSTVRAYRVGAGTSSLVGPSMQDLPTEQVKQGSPAQQGLLDSSLGETLEPKKNKSNTYTGVKQRSKPGYTPEFEAFWRAYQSLPVKAAKQAKLLALKAWNEAIAQHSVDDLQRAVEAQLQVQERELRSERGFTVTMPDCFRWLRDQCYLALLEQHEPAQPSKPSWML